MARRRYQKGSLVPKTGIPRNGLWVGRWREDVIRAGWNYHTALQMGGLGHHPGLPNTETRPARLGSPSVNR